MARFTKITEAMSIHGIAFAELDYHLTPSSNPSLKILMKHPHEEENELDDKIAAGTYSRNHLVGQKKLWYETKCAQR